MEEWKGRKDRRLIEENRSVTTEGRENQQNIVAFTSISSVLDIEFD